MITPLVALAKDVLKRCREAGIDTFVWGKVRPRWARVMIVVCESAISPKCSQFMLDLHLGKRLDRIVFDEAHKLVTDLNYRPKLEELRKLTLDVQMVFLTATFPPFLMHLLERTMVIKNATVIRDVIHKPNFEYCVKRFKDAEFERLVVEEIMEMIDGCVDEEKVC